MAAASFDQFFRLRVASPLLVCAWFVLAIPGCQSMGGGKSLASRFKMPTMPWSEKADDGRVKNDVSGPLQRLAMSKQQQQLPQTEKDKVHLAAVKQGRDFFEDGKYTEAEKVFNDVQKARDPERFSLSKLFTLGNNDRPMYDPIRAEALFFEGESLYMQKNLRRARDNYKVVVKDYPSTAYVDRSSRRLFEIAKQWLGDHDFATSSEITTVNLEEPTRKPTSTGPRSPHRWYHLNPWNKARPVLDTNGFAIDALRTIWTYDTTGPLADDALMLAATHHLRENDNIEADRLFTLLREQFPKSPHLQAAFVLGSHVKLASYQGPAYEEETLEDARDLKESTLRLFPNAPESERIRGELKDIYQAEALRRWENAEFWRKKGKPKAEAVYLKQLVEEFPDTELAERGRSRLVELGKLDIPSSSPLAEVRQQLPKPSSIMRPFRSEPATTDEDKPESRRDSEKPEAPQELTPEQSDSKPARRFFGLLPGKE